MEDLGGEVAAEEAPSRAIDRGADVMLITAKNSVGGQGLGAISENGTILDQGPVGEGVGGDEDGRTRADLEGDNGSILGVEVSEDWFKL